MSRSEHLVLPAQFHEAMIQHAQSELPNECCGLLAGVREGDVMRVEAWHPLVNEAASPVEYRSEPRSMFTATKAMRNSVSPTPYWWRLPPYMFTATKAMRGAGQEIVAIYHSHPTSAPVPSRTDLAQYYSSDVVHFIISLADTTPVLRGWWLTEASFEEATWAIV